MSHAEIGHPTPQEEAVLGYQGQVDPREIARLLLMARLYDPVSVDAIVAAAAMLDRSAEDGPISVAYAGSGPGPGVGEALKKRGMLYLPSDKNEDFVGMQQAAGHSEARLASITDLPYGDNEIDIIYTRLTLGWLGDKAEAAIKHMKQKGKIAIASEADWGVAKAPEDSSSLRLFKHVKKVMAYAFDPALGARLSGDMRDALGEDVTITERRDTTYVGHLAHASQLIHANCEGILGLLQGAGLTEDAETMGELIQEVDDEIAQKPDMQIRFPDLVTVTAV